MQCTHVHTHTSQPQHSHISSLSSYTIPDVVETCITASNQMAEPVHSTVPALTIVGGLI